MVSSAVKLAEKYFELSNHGDLDSIEQLFTESSTYSSQNTGVFFGCQDIMSMMRSFFESFETLEWQIKELKEEKPGVVHIEFVMTGKTMTGEEVTHDGHEYVIVESGTLRHIDVRNH
ncbi:MAG: nuclear transport factor 2 family protein [Gammaproteobacteria bacterium]|nr:nuclear transport factor 2 family protein [Gammaproteobacteria bacterium]